MNAVARGLALPLVVVAAAIVLQFLWSQGGSATWLILVSLTIGMMHGATDILLPGRFRWQSGRVLSWGGFLALYLVLIAVVVCAWSFLPLVTTVLFLLLTAWHWGTGDVRHLGLSIRSSPPLGNATLAYWRRASSAFAMYGLGRGLVIIGAAMAFGGEMTRDVLALLTQLSLPLSGVAWLGAGVLGLGVLMEVALLRHVSAGLRLSQIVEIAALVTLFVVVPVLAAIAVYFAGIHSLRHLLRMQAALPAYGRRRLHAVGLVLLATAIPVAAFGIWLVTNSLVGELGQVVMLLRLIAALTLPHALLVAMIDARWLCFGAMPDSFNRA